MAEYIDKQAAIESFDNPAVERYYGDVSPESVIRVIERIPAADVRPVVKARWVYTDMSRLVCSNCGSPVAFALKADGWHHGDYCPNCGAWMEES